MGQLGADVEALRQLAATMRVTSGRIGTVAVGLDRRTRASGWHGVDADRFAREWSVRHRPALFALADRCAELARSLDAQARQQLLASAGGTPGAAGILAPGRRRDIDAAVRATAPAIAPLPQTEQRYQGGLEIKAGFGRVTLGGDVTIQQLGGGRTRVTVTEQAGVGLVASVGATASASIGGPTPSATPTSGGQAEVRAHGGVLERRSWEVSDDAVGALLAQVAAAEAIDKASSSPHIDAPGKERPLLSRLEAKLLRRAGRVADRALEWVTGVDPHLDDIVGVADVAFTVPAPERVEILGEIDGMVGAGGALFEESGPSGHVGVWGTLRAGTATTGTTRSIIVEHTGRASASLSLALFGRFGVTAPGWTASHSDTVRVELVHDAHGTVDHALIKQSSLQDRRLLERVIRLDLDGPATERAAAGLRSAIDRLVHGDVDGALAALHRVRTGDFPVERVHVMTSTGEVDGFNARFGGSGGAVLTAGVTARGQVLEIERQG